MVETYKLGSMSYYYKGTGNFDNEDTISSVILGNSLLTARGIPVAGEYESYNIKASIYSRKDDALTISSDLRIMEWVMLTFASLFK